MPRSLMRKPNSRAKRDVVRRDVGDALHRHAVEIGRGAEGQRRQQRELVGGVAAADVESRIGFGIAQRLRFLEDVVEAAARRLPSASGCNCRCR